MRSLEEDLVSPILEPLLPLNWCAYLVGTIRSIFFFNYLKFSICPNEELKSEINRGFGFYMGLTVICFIFYSTVADVILWRQKNVTVGILLVALASLVVFERWGYTLLSLVSSVLLLLLTILFLWAKSAAILNR